MIEIESLYNPITLSKRDFWTTFSVRGRQNPKKKYSVEEGYTAFAAKTPGTISGVEITSTDPTVQEYAEFTFRFTPDIEIESGATVMVQFPRSSDYPYKLFTFDPSLQDLTTIGGLFGSKQSAADFTADKRLMKFQTAVPTRRYSLPTAAKMIVGRIRNPFVAGEYGPFVMEIYDENQALIARNDDTIFYTTVPGKIVDYSMDMKKQVVNTRSDLSIRFSPLHSLRRADTILNIEVDSSLEIDCPDPGSEDDYKLNSPLFVNKFEAICPEPALGSLTRKIQIKDPFAYTYEYSEGQEPIALVLRNVKSPRSSRDIKLLKITLTNADGEVIDYLFNEEKTLFTLVPSPFGSSLLEVNEIQTYTDAVFDFTLSITVPMLPFDYMDVRPPPEVDFPFSNSGRVLISAEAPMSVSLTRHEVIKDANGSGFVIRIKDFVPRFSTRPTPGSTITQSRYGIGAPADLKFKIEQLRTPLSTKTSSSFKVYTKDKEGRVMNYIDTDLSTTMIRGKAITDIEVTTSSYRVGDLAAHTLTFKTVVPLALTDSFLIMYPKETSPPIRAPKCEGGKSLGKRQTCSVVQNIVKTKDLKFRMSTTGRDVRELNVGDKLSFTVLESNNTKSEEISSAYKLYILDRLDNVISEATNEGEIKMKLEMKLPALIQRYRHSTTDPRQLALAAYDVAWMTVMPYPAKSFLVIDLIDSLQIGPRDARARSKVRCYSNLQLNLPCRFDATGNQLTLEGLFIEDLPSSNFVGLMISNFFTHVTRPLTTKSWQLTVYTENGKFIEKIEEGLDFTFHCFTPCYKCAHEEVPPNPNKCYSCNHLTGKKIFYDNYCYESCPSGTYFDASAYTCRLCSPNCLECTDNPYECVTCNVFGEYPYLDGTTCKAKCPFGTYGNKQLISIEDKDRKGATGKAAKKKVWTGMCLPCKAPCQSCVSGPDDCNTCDIKSKLPYFQKTPGVKEGKCQKICDSSYTVPIGYEDFTCQKCSSNCATCLGSLDNCITCPTSGRTLLSEKDNTCHAQCPTGVTVEVPGKRCAACAGQCKTCKDDPAKCTSCVDGFYLYKNKCLSKCELAVNGDGIDHFLVNKDADNTCEACDDSCLQCDKSPDKCTKCKSGYLYKFKCVTKCPELYSVGRTKYGWSCILTGLVCAFGHDYNEEGNGCILSAQVCEEYSILNYDKTACIPVPGFLLPFPLTIIGLIAAALIAWDKKKNKQTRFYPTVICALGILETAGLVSLIGLTRDYGIQPAFYLALLGIMFLYGLNLFFTMIYFTQLKKDSSFKYWEQEFPITTYAIVSMGFFTNFKIFRMFYTRFQNRKEFDAVFADELILYRTTMLTSVVYILTVSLPILVASIFGIFYIQFGYQLQMFCIEMALIEVAMAIIMSIELYKIRKHILERRQFRVKPTQMMTNKFNVLAGFQADDLDSATGTTSYRDDRETLQKLIQMINVKDAGKRNENEYTTIKEIQDLHEKEFREHQMRRCISLKDIREYQDEKDEFQQMIDESDSDDNQYNWISEPNSPRSKEMLLNPHFNKRMNELSKAYFIRDKYDNCYHQALPLHQFEFKNCKMISRTVQTNVLELLGVDDLLPQYSKNYELIRKRNLLNQKVDEEYVNENEELNEATNLISRGMVNNVLNNFEGFQEKKKRRKLLPARMRQLPQFEINDLIGSFKIDEDGNFVILRNGKDANGKARLEDEQGRRVNQRGYLMNDMGQILKNDGTIIFREEEVDADGEVPAPFCYWKGKDSLGFGANANMFGPNGIDVDPVRYDPAKEQEEEDDYIEREFFNFKKENNLDFQEIEAVRRHKKVDDGDEHERSMGSEDYENQDAALAPSKQIKRNGQQTLFYNPNDEDFIKQANKPKKAKLPEPGPKPGMKEKGMPKQVDPVSTSIDPDFLINGQLGDIFNKGDAYADDGVDSNHERVFDNQKNADMNTADPVSFQRPMKGAANRKGDRRKAQRQRSQKKFSNNDQALVLKDGDGLKKMDREQEILEGIERFQAMLQRYPLKPKQQRASNTLANKNLNRVYGKIKYQFSKNITAPEHQDYSAGGLQTPSQFRTIQNKAGVVNSFLGSNQSQTSYIGAVENKLNSMSSQNLQNMRLSRGASQVVPVDSNEKVRELQEIYLQEQRGPSRAGAPKSQSSSKSHPRVGLRNFGSQSGSSGQMPPTSKPGITQKGHLTAAFNNPSSYQDQANSGQLENENAAKPLAQSRDSSALVSGSQNAPGSPHGFAISNSSQADQKPLLQNVDSGRSADMMAQKQETRY